MNTDPIADFLTRIRNAISAKHRIVEIPSSNIKKEITRVLHEKGFITNYKFEDDSIQGKIKIALKYNARTKVSAIEKIDRISKPGLRIYIGKSEIPRIYGGMGVSLISTSQGVMTGKDAWSRGIGGEFLCYIW